MSLTPPFQNQSILQSRGERRATPLESEGQPPCGTGLGTSIPSVGGRFFLITARRNYSMNTKRSRLAALVAAALGVATFAATTDAHASTGPIDGSFGTGGVVVSSVMADSPSDVLVQPDNKIV